MYSNLQADLVTIWNIFHEEVGLAWKSRLLGFRVICNDNTSIRHVGISSRSLKARINSNRNRLLILLKHVNQKLIDDLPLSRLAGAV